MSTIESELEETAAASMSTNNSEVHEEVKSNEVDSVWKPLRLRKKNLHGEELETQIVFWKFKGILNKLPQNPSLRNTGKFIDQVKIFEINNEKRLAGITDLIYEQAVNEHHYMYLEAYSSLCSKIKMLKVPIEDATRPEEYVNFRKLIINKCQFEFEDIDEKLLKLENEYAECTPTEPAEKEKLLLMLEAEKRRVRMRSVGNVKFIGMMHKEGLLTAKIIDYCIKHLISKVEDLKLECLCKLLESIGKQHEDAYDLDNIFKEMKDIVKCDSNNISKRVRFMLQDVIDLRKRKWVPKILMPMTIDSPSNMKYEVMTNTSRVIFRKNLKSNSLIQVKKDGLKLAKTPTMKATTRAQGRLKTDKETLEECQLYGQLLAQKLLWLEEDDRISLMNKIDNLVYKTLQPPS